MRTTRRTVASHRAGLDHAHTPTHGGRPLTVAHRARPRRRARVVAVVLVLLATLAVAAPATAAAARLAGADRWATAVAIADEAFPSDPSVLHVARGTPPLVDALAATALTDGPVLLVPPDGPVPTSVRAYVDGLDEATPVVAIGGVGAVSEAMLAAVAAGRPTERLAGPDRWTTAVAVALRAFPDGADVVHLARGDTDDPVDALAGGVLGDGPVLLVPSTGPVPAAVVEAVGLLGATTVTALGGPGAVSDATLLAVADGRPTTRLAGEDRWSTAAAIATHAFPDGSARAYVARGRSPLVDALAGGTLTDGPILLAPPDGPAPPALHAAVDALGATEVVALGGPFAVTDALLASLTSRLPATPDSPVDVPAGPSAEADDDGCDATGTVTPATATDGDGDDGARRAERRAATASPDEAAPCEPTGDGRVADPVADDGGPSGGHGGDGTPPANGSDDDPGDQGADEPAGQDVATEPSGPANVDGRWVTPCPAAQVEALEVCARLVVTAEGVTVGAAVELRCGPLLGARARPDEPAWVVADADGRVTGSCLARGRDGGVAATLGGVALEAPLPRLARLAPSHAWSRDCTADTHCRVAWAVAGGLTPEALVRVACRVDGFEVRSVTVRTGPAGQLAVRACELDPTRPAATGDGRVTVTVGGILADGAVTWGAALPEGWSPPRAYADPCPIHVVVAAGSGELDAERAAGGRLYGGRVVPPYADHLEAALGDLGVGDDQLRRHVLDYTALTTEVLRPFQNPFTFARGVRDFLDSIDDGVARLRRHVDAEVAACATSRFVLAGYSQGAMVLHRLLDVRGTTLPLENVAAVVLVADPLRHRDDPTLLVGAPAAGAGRRNGVVDAVGDVTWIHADVRDRTVHVCTRDDEICDAGTFGQFLDRRGNGVHASYATPELAAVAGDAVLDGLVRHLGLAAATG